MAFCRECGHPIIEGAKYCTKCGAALFANDPCENSGRKQEYEGTIYKCPNCGETLGSFTRNCPSCGFELRGIKHDSAVREFTRKLEAIEANREYESPAFAREARKSDRVSKTDEQKISLIQSFAIPNTKEDMLEFMILATSNYNYGAVSTFESGPSKTTQLLNDAWLSKINQIYEKARISYGSESDFYQIRDLYERCLANIKKGKQKGRASYWKFWLIWLCVMGCCVATIWLGANSLVKREMEKIENIKQNAAEALEKGDYKRALLTVESLDYEELTEENGRSWKLDQELLIEEIIDEAEKHGVHLERTQDKSSSQESSSSSEMGTKETIIENFKQGIEILKGADE